MALEDSEVTFKAFESGNGSIKVSYLLQLLAAMVGKTQGWCCMTVVLLNGDTVTCFYGAITVNHVL